jgi:hypothetical protein
MGLQRKIRRKNKEDLRRRIRRTAGFLAGYFCDDLLSKLEDPRSAQGRTWKSCVPLLKAVTLGLACGCKGLRAVEELTEDMFDSVRKLTGIHSRVPDTTLRDFLCKLEPKELSQLIYVAGYDAWRRGAFHKLRGIPFNVVSCDGKYPSVSDTGGCERRKKSAYLQVCRDDEGNATHGLVRTINSTLVTVEGRPLLGSVPVPGNTNEQGAFKKAFGDLVRIYGRLFKMVMYDAGAASKPNADVVRKAGKHYFFQIKDERWVMHQTVVLLLQDREPAVVEEKVISERKRVVRKLTMSPVRETSKSLTMWKHVRTVLKVHSEHYTDGKLTGTGTRYFVTSMEASELSPAQWLELVVLRWGIENVHQILDLPNAFDEDEHLWIRSDANGALAVMLLRRLVYTMMTLHKSVHLRSEENRQASWRRLMEWVREALKWPNSKQFAGLRARRFAVPPALA